MRSEIGSFLKQFDDLESYVLTHILSESVISESSLPMNLEEYKNKLTLNKVILKQLLNNLVIVSAYGIYEHFTEKCIENYIYHINKLPREKLQTSSLFSKHLELSTKLLNSLHLRKYEMMKSEDIITNLYNTHVLGNLSLTKQAYSLHSANLRIDTLNSQLSNIGIASFEKNTKNCPHFERLVTSRVVFDFVDLKDQVNELVEKRNDIAHKGVLENFYSEEELLRQIQIFKTLCQIIDFIFTKKYLSFYDNAENQFPAPFEIYRGKVLCFEMSDIEISVGDYLFIKKGKGKLDSTYSKIMEIRDESRNSLNSLVSKSKVKFSILVEEPCRVTHEFFIVRTNG